MMKYPTLFKIDTKQKIREWRMEQDGPLYRTVSGIKDGNLVTSAWKEAKPKNVGRSNATTATEQATSEINAIYTKQKDKGYTENINEVATSVKFFKPMLASKWEDLKHKIEYPVFVQPKLDGVRCIASKDGLFTRTGKEILSCPHIMDQLEKVFEKDPSLILDGELYNHDLKSDFNKIISLVRKTKPTEEDVAESATTVQYHIYDVPSADISTDNYNFTERFLLMSELFIHSLESKHSIQQVETELVSTESDVDEFFGQVIEQGYEGMIIRTNNKYEKKRSKSLLKRKDFEDSEFEVVRIEEGQGNWAGYAKRVIFKLEDGRECGSGLAGNQDFARKLLKERDEYVGGQVTVQYFTRTPDGMPRFPVAKAIYKGARDL